MNWDEVDQDGLFASSAPCAASRAILPFEEGPQGSGQIKVLG
jgi:hypothetical protein